MQPIDKLLSDAARWGSPDKPAIIYKEKQITYQELERKTNSLAHGFVRLGIEPNDRVIVFMKNSLEMLMVYFAVIKAGATVVPLNVMLRKGEIEYIAKDTGSKTIIADNDLWEREASVLAKLPDVELVLINEPNQDSGLKNLQHAFSDDESGLEINFDLDGIASIIYTSGTTGRPKGATQTHRSITSNVRGYCTRNKVTSDDRFLCALPLFNNFALNVVMMSSMYLGATLVVVDRFEARKVLDTIQKHSCRIFAGTPTMFSYLLMEYNPEKDNLKSLELTNSGGAHCPQSLIQEVESTFKVTHLDGYGQTEGCGFTILNPFVGVRKPGSVGTPISDILVKIVDDDRRELKPEEVGEIIEKGSVFSVHGYWNRPEANADTYHDGWFYSGDLGYVDGDGYLYVVDRKNDLIITGGANIYAAEVEQVIYKHPAVAMAAVVGIPDDLKGEIPKAFIVLKENSDCTEEEIIKYVRNNIAKYKAPRVVEFVESLPQGPTGKILKRKLRDQEKGN